MKWLKENWEPVVAVAGIIVSVTLAYATTSAKVGELESRVDKQLASLKDIRQEQIEQGKQLSKIEGILEAIRDQK